MRKIRIPTAAETDARNERTFRAHIASGFSLIGVVQIEPSGNSVDGVLKPDDWTILDEVPAGMHDRHLLVTPAPRLAAEVCGKHAAAHQFALLISRQVEIDSVGMPALAGASA